jgi:opacity protein-like surface antigen
MSRIVSATSAVALAVALAASSAQAAQLYAPVHAAGMASVLSTAAAGANASTFVGMTSQFPCQRDTENVFCGTLNIFMTKDMKRVKRLLFGFEAACNSQEHFYGATWSFTAIPTTRSRHNTTASFTRQEAGDQELNGGLTAHKTTSLRGKVTYGRRGSGTFETTINITDQTGQTIDTCATGVLPYHVQALKRA